MAELEPASGTPVCLMVSPLPLKPSEDVPSPWLELSAAYARFLKGNRKS